MILSLDPSTKRTGYALHGLDGVFVEAGALTPSLAKKQLAGHPAAAVRHWAEGVRDNFWRIRSLAADVVDLVRLHGPVWVVVEVPSGQAGRGTGRYQTKDGVWHNRGAGGSLGVMGAVQGAVWAAACGAVECWHQVVPVDERCWTRAIRAGPKAGRPARVAARVPEYREADDEGVDIADAVMLGWWWLECLRKDQA